MDWFCGLLKKQPKHVYEVHDQYNQQIVNQLNLARSNPEQVIGYYPSTDRIKAKTQFVIQKNSKGYVDIKELKKGQNIVIRKLQKSNYEELINQYKNETKNWIDPDFPQKIQKTISRWARIHEIVPKANFMSKDIEISPKMIVQGNLNNCYFLSAVAAIAQRPYRIRNLFSSLQTNKNGIYMCRMTFNGIYQQIVVDDYFPVDKNGQLVYSKAYQNTQFWPLILEKAWAKLFGDYSIVNWGYNIQSLYALTSAPSHQFYMSYVEKDSELSNRTFKQLLKADQQNHLLTASFQKSNQIEQKYSLVTGHAYTILSVFDNVTAQNQQKKKFLLLRNPHGNYSVAPKFKYTANDKFWNKVTAQEKKRINFSLIQNLQVEFFYMQWSLYEGLSDITSISYISDNANYLYDVVSIKNNQARYLSVQIQSISTFHLLVAQPDQLRAKLRVGQWKNIKYATVLILIARMNIDSKGRRKYSYYSSMFYFSHYQTNYCSIPIHNEIPKSRYTIRVFMYNIEGEVTDITLGYYSSANFAVKLLQGIDDEQFVNKTLLSKAMQLPFDNNKKKMIDNIAGSWRVIQTMTQSNIGYIAYRIPAQSPSRKYKITVNQEKNESKLYFLGIWRGKKSFQLIIQSGQQVILVYTYENYRYDPFHNSQIIDTRQLPSPILIPL